MEEIPEYIKNSIYIIALDNLLLYYKNSLEDTQNEQEKEELTSLIEIVIKLMEDLSNTLPEEEPITKRPKWENLNH